MDMNPKLKKAEKELLDKILPLQRKHIFTKTYGDGEISHVTRKDDLTGMYVYFHSNLHGVIKLDGEEFLLEINKEASRK
ncbi:hypothetical protein ACFVSK_21120 [Cellulosimicrobium cellulans]|uniref:hypothetical protein n=1 Tax=Cellulosimicrobium cellulans TaxID=1710 RepID=UPI0036E3F7DB